MKAIADEQVPACEVLEEQGYAAWVRTLNGGSVERPGSPESGRGEISPRIGRFVQA